MRREAFKSLLFFWTFFVCPALKAETLNVGVGSSRTSVISSNYKQLTLQEIDLLLRYSRQLVGRWSLLGQYMFNTSNSLSGFSIGLIYDSAAMTTNSSSLNNEGVPEVSKVPKWLVRTSASLGIFKFSHVLDSTDSSLGNRNQRTVQAQLYGFDLDVGLYRFLDDQFALYGSVEQIIATADSFGLNSTSFNFGVLWKYN